MKIYLWDVVTWNPEPRRRGCWPTVLVLLGILVLTWLLARFLRPLFA